MKKKFVSGDTYDTLNSDTPPLPPGSKFDLDKIPKDKPPHITKKHRKAFEAHMIEKKPLKVALLEAGYSSKFAEDSYKRERLTQTVSWKLLMDQFIPEELVAAAHEKLFNATVEVTRHVPIGKNEDGTTRYDTQYHEKVDVAAVKSAVDMSYKLRGAYKEKEAIKDTGNVYNLFYKPQVRESVRAFEDALKLQIINESVQKGANEDSEDNRPVGNVSTSGTLHDIGEPPQPTVDQGGAN